MDTPPLTSATSASAKPEWLRMPGRGKRCPFTGLTKATLYNLAVPNAANERCPPVKSVVIRKRGALRGVRLISYDSLMAYLAQLPADAANDPAHTNSD